MKKLLIGIATYKIHTNPILKHLTQECIYSVIRQKGIKKHIIIVDDFSNFNIEIPALDSIEIVNFNKANTSKTWNYICERAFYEDNLEHAVLMCNDIILFQNSLNMLLEYSLHNPQYGHLYGSEPIVQPDILKLNSEQIENITENSYNYVYKESKEGWMFSAFMMTKNIYEEVGKFDEHLPFYLNDWDYAERCKDANNPPHCYKHFKCIHVKSSTKALFHDTGEWTNMHEESKEYYRKKWKNKNRKLP